MDVSYRETNTAQIEGNPVMDYRLKEDLLFLIDNVFSESKNKQAAYMDGSGRYFYNADNSTIASDIQKLCTQRIANDLYRRYGRVNLPQTAGEKIENPIFQSEIFRNAFPVEYTRSGHRYVYGTRVY